MNVLGLVLAGGQSRRMGGRDKAFLTLAGVPMLGHVLARLRAQVAGVVISSHREACEFREFGLPVIADHMTGFQGPLAGLAAAMGYAREHRPDVTHVLSVSTDTPFVPRTLAEDLARAVAEGAAASVARSRDEVHWVVGLWPVSALETLEAALESGERKVGRVIERLAPAEVMFQDMKMGATAVDPFFNINTPEDLARGEALLKGRGVPVIGIAGWKGAGKTTLASGLIAALSDRGLRVGSVKHSHHLERSGGHETDTARHAASGAVRVAYVSPTAWGVEPDLVSEPEPPLWRVIEALGPVDLVIVEGMKSAAIPKIEVRNGPPSDERPALTHNVIAIAGDDERAAGEVPVFKRDDVSGLERFVLLETGV